MTTINLRDGLEGLYYFGEQDFNPQRNLLEDHSGYGRHAKANGSVTVGNNGVNDFEAATLSGGSSGDNFRPTGFPDGVLKSNEFTVFVFATINDDYGDLMNQFRNGNGFRLRNRSNRGALRFEFFDANENFDDIELNDEVFGTHTVIAEHTSTDVFRVTVDGDVKGIKKGIGYTPPDGSDENLYIGSDSDGSSSTNMDLYAVGLWSRSLSQLERDYLNALTAPRRSQL